MADRALRGMTIGSKSMESEDNVEFAAHQNITFVCDLGHVTVIPMAIEADIPPTWECSECGNQALLRGGDEPEAEEPKKTPRTQADSNLFAFCFTYASCLAPGVAAYHGALGPSE